MVEFWFGIFFIVVGCISLVAYAMGSKKLFWKRDYYIKRWGPKLGKVLHFISYVVVPILIGLYMIFIGF